MRFVIAFVIFVLGGCHLPTPGLAVDEANPLVPGGEAVAGEQVFVARDEGHCVLCHQIETLDAPFQGNIGPNLTTVGARLTPAQIRFRIIDASRLNPATTMPPYYRVDGLNQVATEFKGKPVLTERQIEDLVAYLGQLK